MHIVHGTSISKGIVSGNLIFASNDNFNISKTTNSDVELELRKFQKARADAMNQLQSIYERALHKVGESNAKIFVIQQMMIHENSFTDSVRNMIKKEHVSAQYAVSSVADRHIKLLDSTGDEYMQARTADIRDLSQRVIRNLTRRSAFTVPKGNNIVLYKHFLSPSEIIEFDPRIVIASITYKGSKYSHSAILARAMSMPSMTDISEDISCYSGRRITVNADCGQISIHGK